jgi:hypothetical protein
MSIFAAPSFYSQADQDIYNRGFSFIPQEQFRGGAFNIPTVDDNNTGGVTTLPVNNFTRSGGGGGGTAFTGGVNDLTTAFQKAVDERQNKLNNPSDRFLGFKTMRDLPATEASSILAENIGIPQEQTFAGKVQDFLTPQSADEIMAEGYQPRVKLGIIQNLLPDKFGTLPRPDQAFIAQNMGYTGPTVFGENTTGLAKDPFGLNVRSGFGNYAERVGVESEKLGDLLSGRMTEKYGKGTSGISFNKATGMFEAVDPNDPKAIQAALNATQMNKMNIAKYQYYTEKTKERNEFREQEKRRQEEAFQAQLNRQQRDQRQADLSRIDRAYREETEGKGGSYATGESGVQADGSYNDPFDPGGGEKDGGFIDGTNRRMDFMMGGLANLVDIYD